MRPRSLIAAPRSPRRRGPLILALIATAIVVPLVVIDFGDDAPRRAGVAPSSPSSSPTASSGVAPRSAPTASSTTGPVTSTTPTVVINPKWLPKGTAVHGESEQATLDRVERRRDLLATTTIPSTTNTVTTTKSVATTTTRRRA